jgi:hypothetical protein
MPREQAAGKTIREDVSLAEDRPVQLETSRRFFSNQGNDRATREARALSQAFGSGVKLSNDLAVRDNKQGRVDATTARGAGEDREQSKNEGYNAAWDQLDAESDLNLAAKDLPRFLEENLEAGSSEKQVQALITQYMKESFEGIDPAGEYGQVMAPGLLALEAQILSDHRDETLKIIQSDQRQTIAGNIEQRVEDDPAGDYPYVYAGEQSNIFMKGSDKRTTYWEGIFDYAIRNGRPDIIENVPDRFGPEAKGEPTGASDDHMQDEIRANIAAATTTKANIAARKQKQRDDLNEASRFNTQYEIYRVRREGGDVTELIEQLKGIPGTTLSDISGAKSFGDGQLEEGDSRSGVIEETAPLWRGIHSGEAGINDIWAARVNGSLGFGPQADRMMDDMMGTARTVQNSLDSQKDPATSDWRTSLNKRYNPQLGGLLSKINPLMQRINIDANAMYTTLISEGTSASDARDKVIERFDPLVETLPDIDPSELSGRKSQGAFTSEQITNEDLQKVLTGDLDMNQYAGVPRPVMLNRLGELVNSEELSMDEARFLVNQLP